MGRFQNLANGRKAEWAFMDRFDAPNYDGDDPLSVYLTRWRVIQTPLGGLYLHRYTSPDPRATLHDHPWGFLSIVLKGGYDELRIEVADIERDQVPRWHKVRFFNRVRSTSAHSIRTLVDKPTWTLLLVGRRKRTWGYWEDLTAGDCIATWQWTEFNQHPHNAEFGKALKRRKEALARG